ncbi:hypothetical protein [Alcaligenes faecalis]|uniref:hypothetical protein n=1 Tax=Alcaligenes faecalis TaxID=511 RepID=UPI00208EBD39|nr:hypothetical protein [Alcaligenes faecalis]USP49335.1 hypothetical protein J5J84_07575 [Alcaligenes faecalis]
MKIFSNEDYSVETQRSFGIAIGFVCGLLCLALFELLRGYDISWPAWIQAIGSVLAILVAVKVADRQATTARELQRYEFESRANERRQTRVDALRAIEKTAEIAAKAARKACDDLLSFKLEDYSMHEVKVLCKGRRTSLEVAKEVLRKLPVQDFPGVLIGRHILNIQVAMDRLFEIFDYLEGVARPTLGNVRSDLLSIQMQLNKRLSRMESFIDGYDGTLGVLREPDI